LTEIYTSALWTVKPGHEDAFVEARNDFVQWARNQPGSGTFRLARDIEDESRFMSFAPWASFDDQQTWRQTDEFAAHMARIQQYVERFRPSTYELILEVE
jgi:heme-degrading monooxygenase HmoA